MVEESLMSYSGRRGRRWSKGTLGHGLFDFVDILNLLGIAKP
jgi:hypothetical protein